MCTSIFEMALLLCCTRCCGIISSNKNAQMWVNEAALPLSSTWCAVGRSNLLATTLAPARPVRYCNQHFRSSCTETSVSRLQNKMQCFLFALKFGFAWSRENFSDQSQTRLWVATSWRQTVWADWPPLPRRGVSRQTAAGKGCYRKAGERQKIKPGTVESRHTVSKAAATTTKKKKRKKKGWNKNNWKDQNKTSSDWWGGRQSATCWGKRHSQITAARVCSA